MHAKFARHLGKAFNTLKTKINRKRKKKKKARDRKCGG